MLVLVEAALAVAVISVIATDKTRQPATDSRGGWSGLRPLSAQEGR
jgi:hypothetical protein